MKLFVLPICFVFVALVTTAQNNFSRGYNEGFPIGYCYYDGIGCIPPITPIVPIPLIGESLNSYLDGYNRGLLDGIKNRNEKKCISTFKKNTNNLSTYSVPQTIPEFKPFTPNFNFYQQVLSHKQEEYNSKNKNTQNKPVTDPNLDKFLKEYMSMENIELRKQFIKLCKAQYSTFTSFPTSFRNGLYKATIIGEPPSGQEKPYPTIKENCTVLVQDNKIIMIQEKDLFGNNSWIYYRPFFPSIQFQDLDNIIELNNPIERGKTTYVWNAVNGYKYGINSGTTYQVFFNEYLSEYNSAQNLLAEVKKKYKSKTTFEKISNGWHSCYLTNNSDLCAVRSVYIENGKLIKWVGRDGSEIMVDSGGEITNCKTSFSKKWPPKSNDPKLSSTCLAKPYTEIFDAYFIDL